MKALLVLALLQQPFAHFLDKDRSLMVLNSPTFSLDVLNQTAVFEANPLTFVSRWDGLTGLCKKLNVALEDGKAKSKQIKTATFAGDATLTLDGDKAYSGKVERAKIKMEPEPIKPELSQLVSIKSELIHYNVRAEEATATTPGAVQLDARQSGPATVEITESGQKRKVPGDFAATLGITGTKSEIQCDSEQIPTRPTILRSGRIEGPVHLHHVRTERVEKALIRTTVFDLTCDYVTLDFTKSPGVMIANGNVKLDAKNDAFVSDSVAKIVVLSFDDKLQLIAIDWNKKL